MIKVSPAYALAGVAVLAALAWVSLRGVKGVAGDVGGAIGGGAVDLVDGVLTGGITAISERTGGMIPTPAEVIKDTTQCRQWINTHGHWSAMGHCSAPAYARALAQ